jgi:ammonia channel protein AmtB
MNFHDFAGSTVVHSIGGWVAIAGAIMLGPRLGRKFKRDGGEPMLPHDLTIAVIGGLILWFGWYGFNPCSTLSIMDNAGVGRVATNTTLAACTGGLAAVFLMWFRTKKWDTTGILNGFLAGPVGITCPCYWVSGLGAAAIGAVAGVIVILAMETCSSTGASTIRSAPGRCMAPAVFGARYPWACSRAVNTLRPDRARSECLPSWLDPQTLSPVYSTVAA